MLNEAEREFIKELDIAIRAIRDAQGCDAVSSDIYSKLDDSRYILVDIRDELTKPTGD